MAISVTTPTCSAISAAVSASTASNSRRYASSGLYSTGSISA